MTEPQIVEGVNSLSLTFPNQIVIIFRKLRSAHPYIRIQSHRNGQVVDLAGQDLGLRSGSGRRELARELRGIEKYKDAGWDNLLLQACVLAEEHATKREPMQTITGDKPFVPTKFLLYPILPEGHVTMLYGEKSTNKSTLARIFAVCCWMPWVANPLRLKPPDHRTKTLILDYEDDQDNYERCMSQLTQGYDLGKVDIKYYRSDIPIEEDGDHIQELIYESEANLLIIDSKNAAVGGGRELNKGETATALFNAIRPLKAKAGRLTILMVDHQAKDEEAKRPKPFGSRVFGDRARYIWELRRAEDDIDENIAYLGMWLNWTNLGRREPPLGYRLKWEEDDTMLQIEPFPVSKVPDFAEKLPARKRILRSLRRGYLTVKQIADETGLKIPTIQARLSELEGQHEVEHLGNTWGLSTLGRT